MDINDWIIGLVEDSFAEAVEVCYWSNKVELYEFDELLDEIRNGLERRLEEDRLSNHGPFAHVIPDAVHDKIRIRMVDEESVYHRFVDDLVSSRMPVGYSGRPIAPSLPEPVPVKAWFNPPYTTVEFSDGSKVTVEQTDFEDSKFSEYAGYCCAVTKKLFGSSTAAFKQFEAAKKKAIEDSPKFKKAEARKFEKARKAIIREEARKRREFQIHMEMERLKTEEEARKRLEAEK